ncbi:MAG: tRNA (cytidine(56)-2'-O)-methyltransferase [Promethearchaeota archaeon]
MSEWRRNAAIWNKTCPLVVLRLGHRKLRDFRVTTHCALVARALGASEIIIADITDHKIEETINDVTKRFGGSFKISSGQQWRKVIQDWKKKGGKIVHLTMYGLSLPKVIKEIQQINAPLLITVGASKIPREIYDQSDWNVAISNQPHSEIASLAIFLDWFFGGKELVGTYSNAKIRILPSAREKKVELLTKEIKKDD